MKITIKQWKLCRIKLANGDIYIGVTKRADHSKWRCIVGEAEVDVMAYFTTEAKAIKAAEGVRVLIKKNIATHKLAATAVHKLIKAVK